MTALYPSREVVAAVSKEKDVGELLKHFRRFLPDTTVLVKTRATKRSSIAGALAAPYLIMEKKTDFIFARTRRVPCPSPCRRTGNPAHGTARAGSKIILLSRHKPLPQRHKKQDKRPEDDLFCELGYAVRNFLAARVRITAFRPAELPVGRSFRQRP
jgi:hypothetical protein